MGGTVVCPTEFLRNTSHVYTRPPSKRETSSFGGATTGFPRDGARYPSVRGTEGTHPSQAARPGGFGCDGKPAARSPAYGNQESGGTVADRGRHPAQRGGTP